MLVVASQFRKKWLHNLKCPEVREIYKIVSPKENIERYQQYLSVSLLIIMKCLILIHSHNHRDEVETRGKFASRKKSRGNENRRWHGTTRTCNIGDKGETEFCPDSSCSLCCIMKSSFDRSFSVSSGMFGSGIYTSATSSKFVLVPTKVIGDAV